MLHRFFSNQTRQSLFRENAAKANTTFSNNIGRGTQPGRGFYRLQLNEPGQLALIDSLASARTKPGFCFIVNFYADTKTPLCACWQAITVTRG